MYREQNMGKQNILACEIRRNRSAREACLRHFGATCQVCGFNSFKDLGVPGIIHVHHKVPAVDREESYDIDPKVDLVPLCPNCHALVHSKKRECVGGYEKETVYTVEQAREILRKAGVSVFVDAEGRLAFELP